MALVDLHTQHPRGALVLHGHELIHDVRALVSSNLVVCNSLQRIDAIPQRDLHIPVTKCKIQLHTQVVAANILKHAFIIELEHCDNPDNEGAY